MSESTRTITEITFNLFYLASIWVLVVRMLRTLPQIPEAKQPLARRFADAFLLLALGDTGHVGFRVWAFALGGLETTIDVAGVTVPLVGAGALATAVTVTFFYMLLLDAWRVRYDKRQTPLYWMLLGAGVVRLVVMTLPQNQWQATVPPWDWSLIRNVPLTIQGLGLAALLLVDGSREDDAFGRNLGSCILVSYAFYVPVILFVQRVPLVGMLMIPKTVAYLVMAVLAWRRLFREAIPQR
jgi:hypothetical protein